MKNFVVRKVAVLGAGVMGAQIAAHCVNAKVPVVLFDLPDAKGPQQERHRAARDRESEEAESGTARQQGRCDPHPACQLRRATSSCCAAAT